MPIQQIKVPRLCQKLDPFDARCRTAGALQIRHYEYANDKNGVGVSVEFGRRRVGMGQSGAVDRKADNTALLWDHNP